MKRDLINLAQVWDGMLEVRTANMNADHEGRGKGK